MNGKDASELREMGARARTVVTNEFSWRRTALELLEAYEKTRSRHAS